MNGLHNEDDVMNTV